MNHKLIKTVEPVVPGRHGLKTWCLRRYSRQQRKPTDGKDESCSWNGESGGNVLLQWSATQKNPVQWSQNQFLKNPPSGAKSSNPTENEDLGKQTKKVLVEKNKCLGLSNKGNKKDLIERFKKTISAIQQLQRWWLETLLQLQLEAKRW